MDRRGSSINLPPQQERRREERRKHSDPALEEALAQQPDADLRQQQQQEEESINTEELERISQETMSGSLDFPQFRAYPEDLEVKLRKKIKEYLEKLDAKSAGRALFNNFYGYFLGGMYIQQFADDPDLLKDMRLKDSKMLLSSFFVIINSIFVDLGLNPERIRELNQKTHPQLGAASEASQAEFEEFLNNEIEVYIILRKKGFTHKELTT